MSYTICKSFAPHSIQPRQHLITLVTHFLGDRLYKNSAVVEMGDCLATIDMGRKVEGCCAPFRGGIYHNVAS